MAEFLLVLVSVKEWSCQFYKMDFCFVCLCICFALFPLFGWLVGFFWGFFFFFFYLHGGKRICWYCDKPKVYRLQEFTTHACVTILSSL